MLLEGTLKKLEVWRQRTFVSSSVDTSSVDSFEKRLEADCVNKEHCVNKKFCLAFSIEARVTSPIECYPRLSFICVVQIHSIFARTGRGRFS